MRNLHGMQEFINVKHCSFLIKEILKLNSFLSPNCIRSIDGLPFSQWCELHIHMCVCVPNTHFPNLQQIHSTHRNTHYIPHSFTITHIHTHESTDLHTLSHVFTYTLTLTHSHKCYHTHKLSLMLWSLYFISIIIISSSRRSWSSQNVLIKTITFQIQKKR